MTAIRARRLRCWTVIACLAALMPAPVLADRLRMGLPTPPSHVWTMEAMAFADRFEQQTGGEHSIAVFPAAQLGNDAQMLQQLQTGALDMVFMPIAELSNRIPDFGSLYAPYLVNDVEGAAKLLASDEARALLDQLPARIGVVGIGYAVGGMRQILARGKVESVDDIKGLKLRITPLDPIRDFYVMLGAAPIPMPLDAVYDALANGQIDAIDMDLENIWKQRYYALGETVVLSKHMMFPMVGLVSLARWRTLDAGMRGIVSELMTDSFENIDKTYIEAEAEYEREIRATGTEVLAVGPEFFGPVLDAWEREWERRAPVLRDLRRLAGSAAGSAAAAP